MTDLLLAYGTLALGLLGHFALWIALFNRVHAMGIPRALIKVTEKLHILAAVLIPVVWACRLIMLGELTAPISGLFNGRLTETAYFAVSCGFFVYIAGRWAWRRAREREPSALVSSASRTFDVSRELGEPPVAGASTKLLSLVPANEMTKLSVTEKHFEVTRLHERLNGLSILHLSDLHFTGKLKRAYFDFVIDRANEIDADLVVVTGDIIDKEAYLDWIPATLGRLQGRHGKFFILGNHDKRLADIPALRKTVEDCGFTDVGGRWELLTIHGQSILLAGNELPWFGLAPELPSPAELEHDDHVVRILLSHSPDQIHWARANEFDLMLAGHTHGGQIRFPIVGPIVAPSHFGVKYASGVFYEPPTLVHVSRGVSGLDPIRINCPPEITRIVLKSASGAATSASDDNSKLQLASSC